jgi:hypothetical protein
MSDHAADSPMVGSPVRTRRYSVTAVHRVAAVVTGLLLLVDGYVHLNDASEYTQFTGPTFSEGTLFRIQAIVAIIVAILVAVWPRLWTAIVSLVIAGSAAIAATVYTYVNVGSIWPLPNLYENTWHAPGKIAATICEGVAALISIYLIVASVQARRRAHQG